MLEIGTVVGFEDMGGGSDGEGSQGHFWGLVRFHFWLLVPQVGFHFEMI